MAAVGNLNIGVIDARVGVGGAVRSAFVAGLVMDVSGLMPFEIWMVVVADVKMKVEETGAHLAVVVPVVGRMQCQSGGTYCPHQQQAGACRRQYSVYGVAKSSHFAAPR